MARANGRLAEAPVTLLHTDLHLDNVMFVGDEKRPVLLDWARVARGAAALDLAEFFFAIGEAGDRDRLIAEYLKGLRVGGVADYDETSLRHHLGGGLLRMFVTWTCGIAFWDPTSARERDIIELGLRRTLKAIAEWRQDDPDLFLT